jgi:hypothetical protein
MSSSKDWLPRRREEQLAMAKKWVQVLTDKGDAWGVPAIERTSLATLRDDADRILTMGMSSVRTAVITAQCKSAFDSLSEKIRFIKKHFLFSPLRGASPGTAPASRARFRRGSLPLRLRLPDLLGDYTFQGRFGGGRYGA